MLRTRRVENLRHGALTTTAGTREGNAITATGLPHLGRARISAAAGTKGGGVRPPDSPSRADRDSARRTAAEDSYKIGR